MNKSAPLNDKQETRRILESVKPLNDPRVMIQIGASEGNLAKGFVKNGWRVIAIDASPTYKPSEEEAQRMGDPNYRFLNKAITLTDEDSVTFYFSEEHPSISSLRSYHPEHKPVTVPAISLKKLYEQEAITAIDFFMIDAEGMDLSILKTHDWSIPIGALQIECSPKNIRQIHEFVMSQQPSYKNVLFRWAKPEAKMGIQAAFTGLSSAEVHMDEPQNGMVFGDVLYYL